MIKILPILLLTSIFLVTFNQNASSHSGRTASDGCHNEKSTGTRHCHNTASKVLKTDTYPKKQFDRKAYNFKSYKYPTNTHSFYVGSKTCKLTVDHVVSLKDIHDSGGYKLNRPEKSIISNDRENHVPACSSINQSKGASLPGDFLRKSSDSIGLDYQFLNNQFCVYVEKYYRFKVKYQLSFIQNNQFVFESCNLKITK